MHAQHSFIIPSFAAFVGSVALCQRARAIYRRRPRSVVQSLECGDAKLKEMIIAALPKNDDDVFWWGCVFDFGGIFSTSLMFTVRNLMRLTFGKVRHRRRIVTLSDGGIIGLDFAYLLDSHPLSDEALRAHSPHAPVVILSHGMLGDANSEYLYFLTERLLASGLVVIVVVSRGCGGLPLKTKKSFHWFDTADYHEALLHLRREFFPTAPFFTVGFSLGAGLLLKYLGAQRQQDIVKIDLAVAISPPWDIAKQSFLFNAWSALLVVPLKLFILKHYQMLKRKDIPLWKILCTKNLSEWDALFVKAYGLETVEEYYALGSAVKTAHRITTPTISISSSDDAICSIDGLPHTPPPRLALLTSFYGGHLGFPRSVTYSWVDDVVHNLLINSRNSSKEI